MRTRSPLHTLALYLLLLLGTGATLTACRHEAPVPPGANSGGDDNGGDDDDDDDDDDD